MEYLATAEFWIGLVQIVWINIILSGDNAVVIGLAAHRLPPAVRCHRRTIFHVPSWLRRQSAM